jgi:hypothetical protein
MVVGRNQRHAVLFGEIPANRFAIFRITVVGHDVAAISFGGGDFGGRRIQRHDDGGGNAEQFRRQRNGLGVIARGERHYAGRALARVEFRQRVHRAAKLECTHTLVVFALEEHLRAHLFVGRARGHDGRAVRRGRDAFGCGGDVGVSRKIQHVLSING